MGTLISWESSRDICAINSDERERTTEIVRVDMVTSSAGGKDS